MVVAGCNSYQENSIHKLKASLDININSYNIILILIKNAKKIMNRITKNYIKHQNNKSYMLVIKLSK